MVQKIDKSAVLAFIKASKVPVGKKEIVEATGYRGDFPWCIRDLMRDHPELEKAGTSRSVKYKWNPEKGANSEMRNSEGYPDGTAGRAIANVMRSQSSSNGRYPMRQSFGEVWEALANNNDDMEGLLVIAAKEGTCIGYNVYPSKKPFMKQDYTMRWTDDKGQTHYVSTINPINISERKLTKRLYKLKDAEKDCVKRSLLAACDIQLPEAEEKVVEKIVEKKVEVPVEVIKEVEKPVEVVKEVQVEVPVEVIKTVEVHADQKDIDLAVYKAKCEIYERLVFGSDALGIHQLERKQA